MSRCIKISTPSPKNRRHGEDKLRRSSPSKRPGELVGRDERVAAAASASVTGAEVPALEAQDEIRVQEAVEQPETVVGRRRGGGGGVLHPARRLLLPHPRPPPAHSRPHRIVKSDTAALPESERTTGRGEGKGRYLNGTRQTAAWEEDDAARASRPEVEAEAGWEAVAAVAMGWMAAAREMGSEGRGMDGWRTHASELSPGHSSRGGGRAVLSLLFFVLWGGRTRRNSLRPSDL